MRLIKSNVDLTTRRSSNPIFKLKRVSYKNKLRKNLLCFCHTWDLFAIKLVRIWIRTDYAKITFLKVFAENDHRMIGIYHCRSASI